MSLLDKFKKKKDEDKKSEDKPVKADNNSSPKKEDKNKSMKDLYSGATTSKGSDKEAKTIKKNSSSAHKVLVKPLITERATLLGSQNKYLFVVSNNANKIEISKAINDIYGIKPISINIVRVVGKKARYGRITGQRKSWKKAIISLPAGKTINIYEGV